MTLERPRKYWKYYLAPPEYRESFEPSKAQREGDAVHCLVLEPDQWDCRYYVVNVKSRVTKAFKQAAINHPDKVLLTLTEYEHIRRMADSLLGDKTIRRYLELPGQPETSFYWNHNESGISLKCRPDRITDKFCLDIKTTKDIGKRAFARDADQYKYFLSAAMTLDGVEAVRGIRPEAYIYLCVENTGDKSPDVASYFATPAGIELGDYQLQKALDIYSDCKATNNWPAVSDKTEPLDPPLYRMRELEKEKDHLIESTLSKDFLYAG